MQASAKTYVKDWWNFNQNQNKQTMRPKSASQSQIARYWGRKILEPLKIQMCWKPYQKLCKHLIFRCIHLFCNLLHSFPYSSPILLIAVGRIGKVRSYDLNGHRKTFTQGEEVIGQIPVLGKYPIDGIEGIDRLWSSMRDKQSFCLLWGQARQLVRQVVIVRHCRPTKLINSAENSKRWTCDDNTAVCRKDFAQAVWEELPYQSHIIKIVNSYAGHLVVLL